MEGRTKQSRTHQPVENEESVCVYRSTLPKLCLIKVSLTLIIKLVSMLGESKPNNVGKKKDFADITDAQLFFFLFQRKFTEDNFTDFVCRHVSSIHFII